MSEAPRGPDWWQASDGKWYSPGQHPGFVVLPPPPSSPATAGVRRKATPEASIVVAVVASFTLLCVGVVVLVGGVPSFQSHGVEAFCDRVGAQLDEASSASADFYVAQALLDQDHDGAIRRMDTALERWIAAFGTIDDGEVPSEIASAVATLAAVRSDFHGDREMDARLRAAVEVDSYLTSHC